MGRSIVTTDPYYRNKYSYVTFSLPGESKVALLYETEMNVGKTVSQEILSYGQGADMLFVTGGSPYSVGRTL